MYLQVLNVSVFSIFKKHYTDDADEYLDANGQRGKIRLTASQSRILCTRLTMTAWRRTLNSVNLKEEFQNIGYTWVDDSSVSPRTLNGYSFDPATIQLSPVQPDQDAEENRIEVQTKIAEEHVRKILVQTKTQATLDQFWKK